MKIVFVIMIKQLLTDECRAVVNLIVVWSSAHCLHLQITASTFVFPSSAISQGLKGQRPSANKGLESNFVPHAIALNLGASTQQQSVFASSWGGHTMCKYFNLACVFEPLVHTCLKSCLLWMFVWICIDGYLLNLVYDTGGFAVVFRVKSHQKSGPYALKRMFVNNDQDLTVCKREIHISVRILLCILFVIF